MKYSMCYYNCINYIKNSTKNKDILLYYMNAVSRFQLNKKVEHDIDKYGRSMIGSGVLHCPISKRLFESVKILLVHPPGWVAIRVVA